MSDNRYEAEVAAFIARKGVTRCPTVCAAPTQASVGEADRAALRQREAVIEARRRQKADERWNRLFVSPRQPRLH